MTAKRNTLRNYNHLLDQPAVPSRHRDQAEATTGKLKTLRAALDNGSPAVWYCDGGAYGYFVDVWDDNWVCHAPYFSALLLLEKPSKEMTLAQALKYCDLDRDELKTAIQSDRGNTLDSIDVGWLDAESLTEEVMP